MCVHGPQEKKQKVLNDNTYKLEGRIWGKLVKGETGQKENHDKQS